MKWLKHLLLALLSVVSVASWAQGRDEYRFSSSDSEDSLTELLEVDTTLFRMPITHSLDSYSDATRYYRVQGGSRRRGLYYTVAEQIVEPAKEYFQILEQPLPQTQVALYGAQSGYRAALRFSHAQMLSNSWSLSSSIWSQTGRDMFVEGVFRNTLSPELTLKKSFGDNHFLSLDASLYYSTRGLQYGSTSEAFELIGSNFYNPSWGFYNGEVRNSRVRRDLNPNLSLHYQRPFGDQTTLILEASADYSRRANSSIGWYDATTPMPDYYRKMPSFMSEGDVQDYVTNIWRTNQTDYTQINWDELVRLNTLSASGNAFYVVEDRVERGLDLDLAAMFHSQLGDRLTLTYGAEYRIEDTRYYKQMRDLLGADYLLDYDQFIGDSYNKTLPLQNNLQNPYNYVVEGDRFGYDYTQYHTIFDAILRAQYRANRFDLNVEATIGGETYCRIGHFEKERFSSSASYGESTEISLSPYTMRLSLGYASAANQYYAIKLVSSRLSPQSRNLFLNETAASYLAPSLEGELINSVALAFRLNSPKVSLSGEVYALQSRSGSSVYSLYDDLTSTMCRVSITDIGYASYGVELTADVRLHSDLKLTATLAAGRYFYDTNPYVELYDDYDLISISSPTESKMSGVNIGNTPQLAATTSLAYFGLSRFIFNLSSSYSAFRYEQPSIARRSERLLTQAFVNDESAAAALNQTRLDDIFDVELGVSRYFWFEEGGRLALRLSVRNLLGQNDRVVYAKESDRIMLQSVDGYFAGASMRESLCQYGLPRTIQLSVTYLF